MQLTVPPMPLRQPSKGRGKLLAHRRGHGRVARDARAHLPAGGVVVSDGPVHGAAHHGVAAAVAALEHPVGVGAAAEFRDGEGEARDGEAAGDGSDDRLEGLNVSKK